MFGATTASPGVRFRQDNDFFYLTGNESLNAALVMDARERRIAPVHAEAVRPRRFATKAATGSMNRMPRAMHGFTTIQPLQALHEFLARRRGTAGQQTLWTRLSERDEVNLGRADSGDLDRPPADEPVRAASDRGRPSRHRSPGDDSPTTLVQDVTPHLDRLRMIKTPREIEILRYNGRISAEALRRAIEATAPGRYEYELEAEATLLAA